MTVDHDHDHDHNHDHDVGRGFNIVFLEFKRASQYSWPLYSRLLYVCPGTLMLLQESDTTFTIISPYHHHHSLYLSWSCQNQADQC